MLLYLVVGVLLLMRRQSELMSQASDGLHADPLFLRRQQLVRDDRVVVRHWHSDPGTQEDDV